jgi:hypothetical protein
MVPFWSMAMATVSISTMTIHWDSNREESRDCPPDSISAIKKGESLTPVVTLDPQSILTRLDSSGSEDLRDTFRIVGACVSKEGNLVGGLDILRVGSVSTVGF